MTEPSKPDFGAPPPTTGLSWPPPGLEQLQNRLAPLARSTWLASLTFTVPILLALRPRPGNALPLNFQFRFSPTSVLATVGFVLMCIAALRLAKLASEIRRGARLGYGAGLLLTVAADRAHDAGTLINGVRLFEGFPADGRKQLQLVRIVLPVAHLAAAWWLAAGFAVAGVLAYLGALGWSGLLLLTMLPVGAVEFGAVVMRALEGSLIKQATRAWTTRAALDDVTRKDALKWQTELDESGAADITVGATSRFPVALAWGVAALAIGTALTLIVPLKVVQRTPTNLSNPFSPMLGDEASLLSRQQTVQVLRRYALPGDSSATPQEAGEALHSLENMDLVRNTGMRSEMAARGGGQLRQPKRSLSSLLPEGAENRVLGPTHAWAPTLFARAAQGFTAEQRRLLERIAGQPLKPEIDAIVNAPGIDVVGARWSIPFPEDMPAIYLGWTYLGGLQEFATTQIATAALQFANGDQRAAERTLRALMTVGFRLADDGPMPNDTYEGTSLVRTGARALARMYRAAGRADDAEAIDARVISVNPDFSFGARAAYREEWFLSKGRGPEVPESIRWMSFANAQAAATCGSLHQIVFRDDDRAAFRIRRAREELVKYPSDTALFNVMKHGWFGPERGRVRCANRDAVMASFRQGRRR